MAKKVKEVLKSIFSSTEQIYSNLLAKNFPDQKIFMIGIFAFFTFISLSGALILNLFIDKQVIHASGTVVAVSKNSKIITVEFINPETKEKRSFQEPYLFIKPREGKKVEVSFNPQDLNEQPSVQISDFYYFLALLLSGIISLIIWPSQLKLIYKRKSVVSKKQNMSKKISSPWIHQLKLSRQHKKIEQDFSTDIAIIGAGIAGISTAYFVLKNTKKKVSLIEAYKVAHGATGHNAGQIVSYFEHPFADLVDKYGLTLAARAQEEIYYTWDTLEDIFKDTNLKIPLHIFTGYAGCSSVEQINYYLRNIHLQRRAGLDIEGILVANIPAITSQIPKEYKDLYARVDPEYILQILETKDPRYIGALASKKGCLNSALFCEEMLEVLITRYPDRFTVYEHSPVDSITLFKKEGKIHIGDSTVTAEKIVLCTNGFENFTIQNEIGEDINKQFHDTVIGKVGYMAAYLEPEGNKPTALSYFSSPSTDEEEPYFYFTRRQFEHKEKKVHTLVSIGGPEFTLTDKSYYERERLEYPKEAAEQIDDFIHQTYDKSPKKINYEFHWHGLMGYTPTRLRLIGPEPRNPVLMYNLGCNGVGILSSIYGGKRIGDWLKFGKMEKSIFDPKN